MDLRLEIAQSKDCSLAESDQYKILNVDSGKILNPTPLSRFNPYDNLAKKTSDVDVAKAMKPADVPLPWFNPFDKLAKKTSDVDVGKATKPADKATKTADVDVGKLIADVVTDLASDKDKPDDKKNEKDAVVVKVKSQGLVYEKRNSQKYKEATGSVEKDVGVIEKGTGSVEKALGSVDKATGSVEKATGYVEKAGVSKPKKARVVVTDVVDKNMKLNVKGPAVVRTKALESVQAVSEKDKPSKVVLTKDKPKDKPAPKSVSEEVKPKRKLALSKVDQIKKKPKLKLKKDADDFQDTKVHHKKKILKSKVVLKRKRDDSSGSDYSDSASPEEVIHKEKKELKGKGALKLKKDDSPSREQVIPEDLMKQLMKNLLKNSFVKEEADEENELKSKKKGKKKEKELTPKEIQHEKYLSDFPILHARTTPTALYTAIRDTKKVNMEKFLAEIGFSSFYKLNIDYIPSRLGRYVVSKFDADTYRLNLDNGESIEATHSKVHEILGIPIGGKSFFSLETRSVEDEFEKNWVCQFYPKAVKDIRVNDIALRLIESKEVDFLFKVNFLTLFTNTMGMVAGFKGEINLDVVRRVREDTKISGIDWCDYIFHCLKYHKTPTTLLNKYTGPYTFLVLLYLDSTNYERLSVVRSRPAIKNWSSFLMGKRQDLELQEEVMGKLKLHKEWTESEVQETEGFISGGSSETSFKEDLFNKVEEKLDAICNERLSLEEDLRKAILEYPADLKLLELHEKYVQIFKKPISLNDGNGELRLVGDGNDGKGDDDDDRGNGDDDDDAGNGDDDDDRGNGDDDDDAGNGDDDDAGNGDDVIDAVTEKQVDDNAEKRDDSTVVDPSKEKEDDVVPKKQVDPSDEETGEEYEITSTPEGLTQWLDLNVDLVEEIMECIAAENYYQDTLKQGLEAENVVNPGTITPEKMATRALNANPIPEKRLVKPSSYLLSPYNNKKTKVVPKITRLEFILGNSLFAMQGEKIERVFEYHSGEFYIYSVRVNMETLAPGLWVDANVVDCWATILNHEESGREVGSPSRHVFPTGCITKTMFDGTLASEDDKFEEFEKEVLAQFINNVGGLALNGIDLAFFPIRKADHFYVVVFSLTKKITTMTILDNSGSGAKYAEKYEDTCELLKKLFARHLKQYGHTKHASISKVKPRIPNLKWSTKKNFRDCGIFTMLHMESYNGEAAAKYDCGLVAESKEQCDMLRRLRFKYATKILLHELNEHAGKMFELAKEFDKLPSVEKMSIISEAVVNREARDKS